MTAAAPEMNGHRLLPWCSRLAWRLFVLLLLAALILYALHVTVLSQNLFGSRQGQTLQLPAAGVRHESGSHERRLAPAALPLRLQHHFAEIPGAAKDGRDGRPEVAVESQFEVNHGGRRQESNDGKGKDASAEAGKNEMDGNEGKVEVRAEGKYGKYEKADAGKDEKDAGKVVKDEKADGRKDGKDETADARKDSDEKAVERKDSDEKSDAGKEGKHEKAAAGKEGKDEKAGAGKEGKDEKASGEKEGKDEKAGVGKEGKDEKAGAGKEDKDEKASAGKEGKDEKAGVGKEGKDEKAGAGKEGKDEKAGVGKEDKDEKAGAGKEDKDEKAAAGKEGKDEKAGAGKEGKDEKAGVGKEGKDEKAGAGKEGKDEKAGAGKEDKDEKAGAGKADKEPSAGLQISTGANGGLQEVQETQRGSKSGSGSGGAAASRISKVAAGGRPSGSQPQDAGAPAEGENSSVDESDSKSGLPVYIFEEHHEALLYWKKTHTEASKAAGKTLPPMSLIHVDAHSDGAPLMPDKRFLFRKRLSSLSQVRLLMTSNDNFIWGARQAGLVSHAMWIASAWAVNYTRSSFEVESIGLSKLRGRLHACTCPKFAEDKQRIRKTGVEDTCWSQLEEREDNSTALWFDQRYCYFKKGPFLQVESVESDSPEELTAQVLARRLRLPRRRPRLRQLRLQPAGRPNRYLLDIDEDFFGVQLPGSQLAAAGVSNRHIRRLQDLLQRLFCPRRVSDEVAADEWFVELTTRLSESRKSSSSSSSSSGWGACSAGSVGACGEAVARDLLGRRRLRRLQQRATCRRLGASELRRRLRQLVGFLVVRFSDQQLRLMRGIGLCLENSLRTNTRGRHRLSVGLCVGNNLPGDSAVSEFVDTRAGIERRLQLLRRFLATLPKPPVAVTLCRSSRDGYVPRHQQPFIERRVLRLLGSVFGRLSTTFDQQLLFGSGGWLRHKRRQLGHRLLLPGPEL